MLSGWRNPFKKTLCPFCFRRFHLHKADLRPLDCSAEAQPENDQLVVDFLRLAEVSLPPVKPAAPVFWGSLRLDNSVLSQHDRVCPYCHLPMPVALARGEADSRIIAIVGDKGCGKSNYFAALIQQLNDSEVLQDAGIDFISEESFDPNTARKVTSQKLWEERMGHYILGDQLDGHDRRPVPETKRSQDNPALITPLIYRFQIASQSSASWTLSPFRSVMLVLYDTAGEDLENRNMMQLWYRYLVEADAIMFLTDPTRLPGVCHISASDASGNGEIPDNGRPKRSKATDVFDNLVSLFERADLGIHDQIKKPTAFVFTKSDALRPILPHDSRIPCPSYHQSGMDLDDVEQLHAELIDHIREWGFGPLLSRIERRFSNHIFTAVSALGSQPKWDGAAQVIDEYSPIRVVDPLFWLLHKLGYLRASIP